MSSPQISAAVTYNARCARSLLSVLNSKLRRRRHTTTLLPNPILLFAFAPSSITPPEVLSDIVSTLTQLYPDHVGCISAPLPYQYFDPSIRIEPHSCSLACAFVNGASFRSTISGCAQASVGRWHAARQRELEDADEAMQVNVDSRTHELSESGGKIDWEAIWNRSANSVAPSAPESKTLLDSLKHLDSSTIDNIIYFSDKAPEGLGTVLESLFPQANKLSLIASSTPFITGRPVTLFYNGSILSDGAVGIALGPPSLSPPAVELSFPPLFVLSTDLSVTSSEGNLILSLDSGNPAQLLLSAIQEHGLASSSTTWVGKEDEFYVGVIDPLSQQLSQLHRINAGDPSRGAIALDAVSAPGLGSTIRLYHLSRDPGPDFPRYLPDTINSSAISLFAAPEMTLAADGLDNRTDAADSDHAVVLNAFLAASENGFTLSHHTQGPWKCLIPGGRTGLSWKRPALH